MRLADFILANVEPILVEWEAFARTIAPAAKMDQLALRDHAEEILRAAARDMASAQTSAQQSSKSKGGGGAGGTGADRLNGVSDLHGVGRVESGFDLMEVVSEYRALRASVIRLWRESGPDPDLGDFDDLIRFNETIDQSLARAVRSYTQRVDRSRQMFLAILGHDLRNPLTTIAMSAAALSQLDDLDPESAEMVSQIRSSTGAMDRMVHDLLDFTSARLGGSIPLATAAVDLRTVCREVVDEMRAAHPACTLRFDATGGDVTGEWDAARLRQVVSNLVGNAIQHGGGGPSVVDVRLGHDDHDVRLAVRNEGPPIPPEALPTLFDPLVRGPSSDSRKHRRPGSIGLGLYIAREIVAAHGGAIDVESSAEAGTLFTVRLPRRRAST